MRLSSMLSLSALLACTTAAPQEDSDELVERCSVGSCFNRLQVRNFELLDKTSLLIFVGSQDCPFLIEFTGPFCDLTFLPGYDIPWAFSSATRGNAGRIMNTRICRNDMNIGIADRTFTTAGGGQDAIRRGTLPCTIRNVRSLTDDEVLEAYVENHIAAPPPPFGTGQIQVDEDAEQEEGAEEGGEASPEAEAPAATAAQ